ncbi:nucleoside hydrolase [Bifidobacterium callitrichos]|uniref:Nucleoside hydrolase n=1 Tax=Bifidobacterium callitrichos TaxID=762209 RepID=A0A5M9ZBT2_9BIFI|nr:nucleoside hydrolase [Bifidobacterium callitrichos]KAA8815994.1 nucleoside hydrolase [Bifidobacterium callitrichos]
MPHSPTRIVACVDTGVDDAMALAYLLALPHECELLGVLAGYGNVDEPTAFANTRYVLDLFGHADDVPVFHGSTHPSWADSFIPDAGCAKFHGTDGLGGLSGRTAVRTDIAAHVVTAHGPACGSHPQTAQSAWPTHSQPHGIVSVGGYPLDDPHANPAVPAAPPHETGIGTVTGTTTDIAAEPAARLSSEQDVPSGTCGIDFLIEQVRAYGHDVTVLATGPLTDVDAALAKAPDIAPKLRLVMMGGTLTQPGNCWDAVAETNVIQDPEAADRVFHSGADVTMVGLDVTHQCLLSREAAARWRAIGETAVGARGRFLAGLAEFSIAANLEADPTIFAGGMPLHDPLAAAVALDPTLVGCFDIALKAETVTGDFHGVRGRTTGDPAGLVTPDAPRVHVALQVDVQRFLKEFTDRLASLCRSGCVS